MPQVNSSCLNEELHIVSSSSLQFTVDENIVKEEEANVNFILCFYLYIKILIVTTEKGIMKNENG